jgi:crotonobetainyl-CoA:carnitine CoA-transferase CaiB-like acyl-CoA transferase
LPLDGILVVALEQAVSAPFATRQLVDLGARVIKIESVTGGDFARDYDDDVLGQSSHFVWANRGKESVALDIKNGDGRADLEMLLDEADVFVQNLAPQAARRLGLDARTVRTTRRRLVAVDVSGYGRGGPMEDRRAYDLLVQSEAGSCSITGTADAPAKPGIPVADIGAAMYVVQSVLGALMVRDQTGEGTAVSVGLFDVVTEWMGFAINKARYAGSDLIPNGLSSPTVAPYGAYRTSDGHLIVLGTTNDGEWQRLACQVLDRPDLAGDPRFATNADRVAGRAELDQVLLEWAGRHTLAQARSAAEGAELGHARVNTPSDLLEHPQLAERKRWYAHPSPPGEVLLLQPPADVDGWQWPGGAIPGHGEHTAAVLAEFRARRGERHD